MARAGTTLLSSQEPYLINPWLSLLARNIFEFPRGFLLKKKDSAED